MAIFPFPKTNSVIYRNEFILQQAKNRRVLHCGFTDSIYQQHRIQSDQWLHSQLQSISKDLWGVDIDEKGIDAARMMGFNQVEIGNIEQFETILPEYNFDLILAPDVIEHLANPGYFLIGAIQRLHRQRSGQLLITTPNAQRLSDLLLWLMAREINHPEHLVSFTANTLKNLVVYSGGRVVGWYLYLCHTRRTVDASGSSNLIESGLRSVARVPIFRWFCRAIPAFASGFAVVIVPKF